jgi:ribose transport system ATP-binding protein
MTAVSLELSGVTKRYPGVLALDCVSFQCRPGEIHAVLGENGSGKSTMLGVAGGAVAPDEARVTIMGRHLATADPLVARRLGLAIVYQDDSLVREMTVAENLVLGAADGAAAMASKRVRAAELLAPFAFGLAPDMMVGQLTPAQRQFLEIVKALANVPKVLLLDEPTASLDVAGVETLSAIIRRVTAAGTAVVYVSHRLPEILALADRVTVLRDGVGQGTYDVDASLSEADLIALMVGRPVATGYPQRRSAAADATAANVALSVRNLSGRGFRALSFDLQPGEILGFAGAEGNGQRDALRALGGLEPAAGTIACRGKPVHLLAPSDALNAGILSLSADRAQESVFPVLGVRENMTVQILASFASAGLMSGRREQARARAMADELNVVTPTLEQPIRLLSGGNQQKTVLARAFLRGAHVVLIDEPTQGVDANARFDLYRAIRARVDLGLACVVNSSDAMELAGICDRVLVFSRGRVVGELRQNANADAITEESIVASFLRATEVGAPTRHGDPDSHPAGTSIRRIAGRLAVGGSSQWWVPLTLLLLLTGATAGYAATQTDVFLTALNIRHILLSTAPLALVTMAQFNVLLARGFDMSVGALMSLTVVLASFLIGTEVSAFQLVIGVVLGLLAGAAAGGANGALVRFVGINPVIATIATQSVLQGIALFLRPSPRGGIDADFMALLGSTAGSMPLSFFVILAAAVAGDCWLYATRSGLRMRAVGFRQEAAKRNGVRLNVVHLRAYLLSSLMAVVAGFFLASEVGVGHPVIGAGYTLKSIAAAVLAGAALSGGRGSFVGALFGALFFTVTVNIIALLGLNTGAGIIASGALTLFAVFLYSGWQPLARLWLRLRARAVRATSMAGAR